MSPLLFVGAATAVVALAVLNWLLFGWSRAGLDDLESAHARLVADMVDFSAGEGVLSDDGRAALVLEATSERIGVVVVHGSAFVTRAFTRANLREVSATEDGDLTLELADFTFPRVTIRCADAGSAQAWAERLRATQMSADARPA